MTDDAESGTAASDRDDERATLGVDGTPFLVLERDADRPARGRTEVGLFHTAFRVPSRAALSEAPSRVRDRWRLDGDVEFAVEAREDGFAVTDADGTEVRVRAE